MEPLITAFAPYGLQGLIIAWLLWERRAERQERAIVDKAQTDALVATAAALAALSTKISATGAR